MFYLERGFDLGVLDYVPDIKNNPQAMEVITELVAKLPDMEIDGVMSEEMEARVWELRMPGTFHRRNSLQ